MAVFTAIATKIVLALKIGTVAAKGAVLVAGSKLLGSIAVSLIATGLAVGTSKILGVFRPPGQSQSDPGVKVQLGPSTDNKVPRMYGRNFTGGVVVDAEIKNQNKTMAYVLVISEYSDADTWTVNDIYKGDTRLLFAGANVTSGVDPNATSTTNIANKIRCRVYAGGSSAADQIFPTTNPVNAYGTGPGQIARWTAANTMEDLVFAVYEMDYDPENDLVGLDAITFDINNALTEPSNVLLDYATNTRYGAGIPSSMIDTASLNDWFNYATAQVDYINTANATVQHNRYQIDGALSTFVSVKDNIGRICQSGGAFFTYNAKVGKFGVVVNRPATSGELANAFVFNDDNIISSVSITGTELYSLFNQIEVEYASVNQRDQTDVYFAEVDPSIRNPNEPDNKLTYRLDMVNDRSRVAQLANVDINQSRIGTVIEFTADFSSMTVDVGDVVKLTLPLYGYADRLFRVMRVVEQETADGMISFAFTLLEYNAEVYDDLLTQEDLPPPVTGITNWWITNSNAVLQIGNITVVNDPTSANAQQYYAANGVFIGNVAISSVRAAFGSAFKNTSFVNVPIKPPVNTAYNLAKMGVVDLATNTPALFSAAPISSLFPDDEFFNFSISTTDFNKDEIFYLEIQMQNTETGAASRKFVTGNLNVIPSNVIVVTDMAPGASGAQILRAGVSNTNVVSGTTYLTITPAADIVTRDIRGVDPGVYALETTATSAGTYTGPYDVAMQSNARVWYSNATSNVSVTFNGGGVEYLGLTESPPQLFDNQEIILDPTILANIFPGSVAPDQFVSNITIKLDGYSTLGTSPGAERAFGDQFWNLFKLSRNEGVYTNIP